VVRDWYFAARSFKRLRRFKIQAALRAVQLLRCAQHSNAFGVQGFKHLAALDVQDEENHNIVE
jgi:hypothetical protein